MQHRYAARTCSIVMQHGHAPWSCSKDMHYEHAARTSSIDMQQGHAARTCSKDMRHGHTAWICGIGLQHGHADMPRQIFLFICLLFQLRKENLCAVSTVSNQKYEDTLRRKGDMSSQLNYNQKIGYRERA
jgi:hypothetical protein